MLSILQVFDGKEWLNLNDVPKHWTFHFLFQQTPALQAICVTVSINNDVTPLKRAPTEHDLIGRYQLNDVVKGESY